MPTKRASVLRVRDWQGETAQQQPSTPLSSSTSPAQHLMLGGGGVAEEGLAYMMPEGPLPPPAYQMPHEEREENTAEGVLVEEGETQHRAEEGTTAVSMLAESSDEEDEEYGHRRQQEDEPPEVEAYSIRDYAEGQRVNPPYDGEESREDSRDSHQVWRDAHLNRDGRGVHDQRMAPPQHKHQTEHNRSHNEPRSLGHKSQRAGDDAENRSMTTSHQTQRTPHHPQQQRPSYPPPSFEDSVNRTHPPHATASRNQPQHQQHHEAKSHTASPQYANQPPRPAPTMPPAPAPHTSLPAGGGVVPVHPGMQYVPGYPPHHQLPPGVAGPGYHGQPMPPPMPMPPMHHGNYPAPYGHPFVPPQSSPYGPPPLPPQAYAMGPVPSPAHHPPYSPIPMQGGMPPPAPGYGAPLPPPPMRPSAGGAPAPNDGFRQKAMSLREFIPADERIKCLHIAPPPDKVVSAVSGGGGERDNNSKRAFPTQEAIRAYFGPNVLTVEILNGNHPINPSYAFIEFDTREHAVQSFLQLGLFVKIADVPLKLGWSKTYREPIIKPKQQQQPMFNPAQMSRLSPQEQLLAEQYAQFLQQDKARGGANQQEGTTTNAHYPPNRGVPQGPHHSNHPPHHPAAFEQRGQGRENRHAPPMEHNHTNNSNFRGYPPPPQSHSSQPAPYTPYPPYGGHADGGRTDGDMRPPHRGPRTEAQHPTPPYHQHQYHPQQHHQQHQQQPQHNHSQPQPLPQHQPQSVGRHPHPHQHQQHGGPHHAPTHRRGEDADRRPPPPSYADDVRRPPSRF